MMDHDAFETRLARVEAKWDLIDAKLNRVLDELRDIRTRLNNVESGLAIAHRKIDRLEPRLDRIE